MPRKTTNKTELIEETRGAVNIERLFLWPLVLVLSVALAWTYTQYHQTSQQLAIYQDPVKRQQLDLANEAALLTELKTKIDLPEGEPAISVIIDADNLKQDQAFFRDCQNGDRLVLYEKFAVLYRPSTKQVVNSGEIKEAPDASKATAKPRLTVEVRNGSDKKGQASGVADNLKKQGWLVLGIDNAATTSYQGNLIVAADQSKIGNLAADLKASVTSSLPTGEVSSSADMIIILGN